jgi:hypothetical protein
MLTKRPYKCGNCPSHYDQGDGHFIGADIQDRARMGQCRVRSPAWSQGQNQWPQISFLAFCGEHPLAPLTQEGHLLAQIRDTLLSSRAAHRDGGESMPCHVSEHPVGHGSQA